MGRAAEVAQVSIRVALVDDHAVVRAGFRRLLESAQDLAVVGEAAGGEEALELCHERRPDLVVLDLSMPKLGGLDVIERLLRQQPALRILVLSVHEYEPFPSRALEKGAMGYLSKRCAADELITAVREVAAGRRFLGSDIARRLALTEPAGEGHLLGRLTPREFQVFSLLAAGKTVNEIAETIFLSPKTVHVHRANVLKKLDARSTADVVRIAIRNGVIDLYG